MIARAPAEFCKPCLKLASLKFLQGYLGAEKQGRLGELYGVVVKGLHGKTGASCMSRHMLSYMPKNIQSTLLVFVTA